METLSGKTSILIVIFLSAILTLFLNANAQPPSEKPKEIGRVNNVDRNLPPLNASEFIKNIKYFADHELFLRDSFFHRINLLQFAHAKSIENLGSDENYLLVKEMDIEGVGVSMDVIRRNSDERRVTRLATHFYSPSVNVDSMTKIFGPIIKIEDPYKNTNSIHPTPLLLTTHKYGNLKILQVIKNEKVSTEIYSLISGDGLVSELNIIQTREK